LFGLPAAALALVVVDLRDLWGSTVDALVDALIAAPDWPARVRVLDAMLRRVLVACDDRVPDAGPDVEHLWAQLFASGGTMRMGALATEVGWSRRRVLTRFKDEYGLPPKSVARVMRFEHAAAQLVAGRALAEVAAACGYADQPHLNEEWRSITGMTPRQWLLAEIRDIDDGAERAEVQDGEPVVRDAVIVATSKGA
jgi:AraC-like DNA-binding protein